SSGHAAVPLWRRRLAPADGQALGLWLATRLSLAVATLLGAARLADDDLSFAQRWARWDFGHFESVTEVWYSGAQPDGYPLEAFFPGLPAVLWLLARLGLPLEVGGLLVSLVAGAVAVVALRRLADLEGGPGTGNRAGLALVLSPPALFLAAPYTEALFLACAAPGWPPAAGSGAAPPSWRRSPRPCGSTGSSSPPRSRSSSSPPRTAGGATRPGSRCRSSRRACSACCCARSAATRCAGSPRSRRAGT